MSSNNIKKLDKFQSFIAYMGGSTIQTVLDNPITSYRQLIQQYAKDKNNLVDPKIARQMANRVFISSPISASLSGLTPRLFGVSFKTIPKFGFFWGITHITGEKEPGLISAIGASIFSAYCINPIRMIEKQQRVELKNTGKIKPVIEILKEAKQYGFKPLFRGTTVLMGHSAISAMLGLVGQPKLQRHIMMQLTGNGNTDNKLFSLSKSSANLIASALVSPIYVVLTNPLSRLEVIMQTNSIHEKSISLSDAVKEFMKDSKEYGMRGLFRGQGMGVVKAVISLSLFHEGRMFMEHIIGGMESNK
jgi:hypothetical protein